VITLSDGAFPTYARRRVTAPPDLLTALFANVKGVRHIKRESMKKSPMLMQGLGGRWVWGFWAKDRLFSVLASLIEVQVRTLGLKGSYLPGLWA